VNSDWWLIRLTFFALLTAIAGVSGGSTIQITVNGQVSELSAVEYERVSQLQKILPKGVPLDGLVWLRPTNRAHQAAIRESCIAQLSELSRSFLPIDVVTVNADTFREQLIILMTRTQVTGRVLEYGSIDPFDVERADFFDRRLRDGDVFILENREAIVITWDAANGFRERPHRPVSSARDYGLHEMQSGSIRGDWAYVIAPSGRISQHGLGRHNRSTVPVANGSLIFFPPPGFGRSDQPAYACIANLLATQVPSQLGATQWWQR